MLDTDQRIRDLSAVLDDISGPGLQPETLKKIRALDIETLPVVSAAPELVPVSAPSIWTTVGRPGRKLFRARSLVAGKTAEFFSVDMDDDARALRLESTFHRLLM